MSDPRGGVCFGPFLLDPAERLLLKDGRMVPLTPKAFDLLALLVASPGHLLSKDELIEKLWPGTFVEEANLAYNVSAIRKALGEGAETDRYIETVPRRGYRFVGPVSSRATGPHEQSQARDEASGHDGTGPSAGSAGRAQLWLAWTVAAVTSLGLIGLAVIHFREAQPRSTPVRFQIPNPLAHSELIPFAISPNGRHLAYGGAGTDGIVRLWVRDFGTLEPRSLSGTESNVRTVLPLFWSPDSAFVAYASGGQLMKVGVAGGAPQPVCELPAAVVGGTWFGDVILVGNSSGGLMACPSTGGTATPVTTPPSSSGIVIDLFPSFLPDGQHFLFTRIFRSAPESSGVFVGALENAPAQKSATRLLMTGFGAAYVDDGRSDVGRILFVRDGTLFGQPFNPRTRELDGDPVRVASPVGSYLDYAFFSASARGLVFKAPEPEVQLTWFDRRGTVVTQAGEPGHYSGLALSPDGLRAVVVKQTPKSAMEQDVWLFDLLTNMRRQLTFDPLLERSPIWEDDGGRIVFTLGGGASSVYELSVSSAARPRLLFQAGRAQYLCDVSRDQRFLLYSSYLQSNRGQRSTELWVQPLGREPTAEPSPLLSGERNSEDGQFSPDGRLVAYVSNPAGRREVFVATLRHDAGSVQANRGEQVSKTGGVSPRCSADGRELFYLTPEGILMAVDVHTDRGFQAGAPTKLFQVPGVLPEWGAHPDRTRFLLAVPVRPSLPFEVVLDGVSVSAAR